MSTIVFRGKTYNSVFDMPDDVRKAYQREKRKPTSENKTNSGTLADLFELPNEVREMYQRALRDIDVNSTSSRSVGESQRTRDLRPPDENLYRPSPPIINQTKGAIEPESGTARFVLSLFVGLLLLGIAYFVFQYMP